MATAKALTAAEVQQVLNYTAKHNFAQRNKLMFLMTVAADRVKHGHARTVYINTRLQTELAEYINERKWLDGTQPLFYTHRGPRRAFSPNTLAQHFHYVYKRVGIKQGSSHSGRKTFLTSLASQGISVFVLASLAGHKSITTTQKYVTVNADMNRRAVELV